MKRLPLNRWSRKLILIPAAVLLLYSVLGFLVLPAALRWYLPEFSENRLNARAEIGSISINPFTLGIEAKDFKLKGPDGDIILFEKVSWRFKAGGLFDRAVRIAEFNLEKPIINLIIYQDGLSNFAKLAPHSTPPDSNEPKPAPDDPTRMILEEFAVKSGKLTIADQRQDPPTSLEITDISLDLKALSTIRDQNGIYSLSAKTSDEESLEWRGEISLVPFQSKGNLTCTGISARTPWSFLQDVLNLEPPTGKINLSTDYRIESKDGSLRLTLDNLGMNVSDCSLKLPDTEEGFFELNSFDLESAKFDLASRTVEIGKVLLDGGKLRLHIDKSGGMNIGRIVKNRTGDRKREVVEAPAPALRDKSEDQPWTANFDAVEIKNVALNLEDRTWASPLTAEISNISINLKAKVETGADLQVQLGETFVDLDGIRIGNKQSADPIFNVEKLSIENCGIDLRDRSINVSRIGLNRGSLDAGLEEDGEVNLKRIFSDNKGPTVDKPGQQSGGKTTWKYLVKVFELQDFRSAVFDHRVTGGALYNIKELKARITGIDGKSPMGVEAVLGVEQGGTLTLRGTVDPSARSAEMNVKAADLVLTPLQPYLEPNIALTLQSGAVSTEGNFRYGLSQAQSKVSYEGSLSLDKVSLSQPGSKEPYIGWGAMQLLNLKTALEPNRLQVGEVRLDKPFGELIIAEDQTINLTKLIREQPAKKPRPATPSEPRGENAREIGSASEQQSGSGGPFPFNIDMVRINEGNLLFADLSLSPKFMSRIHDLKGVVTGLTSEKGGISKIELAGGVDRYGSAKVSGSLDIGDIKRSTELNIVFRNVEMANITPYSGKFAGRKIKSGKLSSDLKYQIRDNKLVGDNKIIVENLVLGEHVDSPNAINLPLDLAIALLSDSNGRIDIGLPLSGDLNDPRFSIAPLVWKALGSLITKTVTAPFRALAGLFGGGEEQKLDTIQFEPGKAELRPPEKEKLKNIALGLKNKTQLIVVVQGRYSPELDGVELKELNLRREVADRMGLRLGPGEDPGPLNFRDSKVRSSLQKIFSDRFGEQALKEIERAVEKGEIGPREAIIEARERNKPKKEGIFSRALSAVKVHKIVPGMKSPEESELLAGELYFRLMEGGPIPEKDLLQMAAQRGQAILGELEKADQIMVNRVQIGPTEPLSGEDGTTAKLSLELSTAR